jgi:hypothetical protein
MASGSTERSVADAAVSGSEALAVAGFDVVAKKNKPAAGDNRGGSERPWSIDPSGRFLPETPETKAL